MKTSMDRFLFFFCAVGTLPAIIGVTCLCYGSRFLMVGKEGDFPRNSAGLQCVQNVAFELANESQVNPAVMVEAKIANVEFAIDDGDRVVGSDLRRSPSEILPGEPFVVKVTLRNNCSTDRELDLGANGLGAFGFEISDAVGNRVATSPPEPKFGISASGKKSIPKGTAVETELLLNMWASTILAPGKYDVLVKITSGNLNGSAKFSVRVLPPNDRELAKLLVRLSDTALDSRRAVAERHNANLMLTYSRAPLSIPAIARVLKSTDDGDLRREAILALGRIPTVASVRELTTVALSPDGMASLAASQVYAIHDSATDPTLRDACKAVMAKHVRKKPTTVID